MVRVQITNPQTGRQVAVGGRAFKALVRRGTIDPTQYGYFIAGGAVVRDTQRNRALYNIAPDVNYGELIARQALHNALVQDFRRQRAYRIIGQTFPDFARRHPFPMSVRKREMKRGNKVTDYTFVYRSQTPLRAIMDSVSRRAKEIGFVSIVAYGNQGQVFSTPYTTLEEALTNFYDKMDSYEREYSDEFSIDKIIISVFDANKTDVQGASRSIITANKVWKIYDLASEKNCLYHAVVLGLNPEDADRLSTKDKQMLVQRAKDLKRRTPGVHKNFSGIDDAQKVADYTARTIKVYNNIFEKTHELLPTTKKSKGVIELQFYGNHCRALLRWKDLGQEPPRPTIVIAPNTSKTTLIRKYPNPKPFNDKYATWDIEATGNGTADGFHKCYAVGIAWYSNGKQEYADFWGMDAQSQFVSFLYNNRQAFDGYTLYAHNGGKYDLPNLMRECLLDNKQFHIQDNAIELNNSFIHAEIHTDDGCIIKFRDSLRMLPGSLDSLTKEFKVQHQKLTGEVDHERITIHNWHTHLANLKPYLENDCKGLLEVVDRFARDVYKATNFSKVVVAKNGETNIKEGGINITDCFTSATLAKKLVYNKYYNQSKYPLYTLRDREDAFIRKSYFGGRVEITHLGKVPADKLYYLDFTSLYPAVGRNMLPYGEPMYVVFGGSYNPKFFGFMRVQVRTVDATKRPIHATIEQGRLVFPIFKEWTTITLFSEEVRLGLKTGIYEYKPIDGYAFKAARFLRGAFDDCFKFKQEASKNKDKALAKVWKIIINSIYGFFALRTKDRDGVLINSTGDANLYEYLNKGKLLGVTEGDKYTIMRVLKDLKITDLNVGVSASITSYARMLLWNLINDINGKGCSVYMCDTDSVITDCRLCDHPDLMEKYMADGCGDALGMLKNECNEKIPFEVLEKQVAADGGFLSFDECILGGCKFYALRKRLADGSVVEICKCKGYRQKDGSLSWDDFERSCSGETIRQQQTQFRLPKSNYISETSKFGLRTTKVSKIFKFGYTKGVVHPDGTITPLIL